MDIQTLSMETDKSQIEKILSHKVTRPVQIESHGHVVGMITPQNGFDREHAERAERLRKLMKKMSQGTNLSQEKVDELLAEDD